MQGKADEDEAGHAGQRRHGLRLRRHPPAEGLAAGDQAKAGRRSSRGVDGGAHRRLCHRRRVGAARAPLHEGKLVAQAGDAARAEAGGERVHEGVVHAGACPVGEDDAGSGVGRPLEQGRDLACVRHRDAQRDGLGARALGRAGKPVTHVVPGA